MPQAVGETNLNQLIRGMQPILEEDIYVFARLPRESSRPGELLAQADAVALKMLFREREGWTAILTKSAAERLMIDYSFECRQITLNIHSSLEAVGFLAAITARLARLNIGVNPVSAYYHDHIFVPHGSEDAVVNELQLMRSDSASD